MNKSADLFSDVLFIKIKWLAERNLNPIKKLFIPSAIKRGRSLTFKISGAVFARIWRAKPSVKPSRAESTLEINNLATKYEKIRIYEKRFRSFVKNSYFVENICPKSFLILKPWALILKPWSQTSRIIF